MISKSSGYWIVDLDINSPHTVDHLVPEMRDAILLDEDCDRFLYCGQPYLVPAKSFIWLTHWLAGPAPKIRLPVKMNITRRERVFDGEKITFHITGKRIFDEFYLLTVVVALLLLLLLLLKDLIILVL